MKIQKIVESSGVVFIAVLLCIAIAFAASKTWPSGSAPQADPGEGNVRLAVDFDEDGIIDWNDWDDTDPEKKEQDLLPENIKKGVDIFGVVGDMKAISDLKIHCRVQNGGYGNCVTPSDWCELNTNCSAQCNAGSCGSNCGTPCHNSIQTKTDGTLSAISHRCPGQTRVASIQCEAY